MDEVLKGFLMDMEELQQLTDTERIHCEADELLADLAYFLGKRHGYKQELRKIIEVYDSLDKWYA